MRFAWPFNIIIIKILEKHPCQRVFDIEFLVLGERAQQRQKCNSKKDTTRSNKINYSSIALRAILAMAMIIVRGNG